MTCAEEGDIVHYRSVVVVPRGHTTGQYLDRLIEVLARQAISEGFIEQVVTDWVQRARVFMPYDVAKALIVTVLVTKEISFDAAAALATSVLDKFDLAKAEKERTSRGTYAH